MNRFERRKAESIKRKVQALPPAARELAIQTGMELHDAIAEDRSEKRMQEIQSLLEKEWASRYDELCKQASEEQANRFTDRVAEVDRKAREYLSDLVRWRQAYLATYVTWLAAGGSPEPQGQLTSKEAIEAAAHEFKDRLEIIANRVEKDAGHFDHAELLYGALQWLATTYRDAKTGIRSCPDLDKSCRQASTFSYVAHQSEVTMGQYASDYEVTWGGKGVMLREHVGFGTSRDPRHTIRSRVFPRRQNQEGRRRIHRNASTNPSDVTPHHTLYAAPIRSGMVTSISDSKETTRVRLLIPPP